MKKGYIKLAVWLLLAGILIGRIAYVNVTYPYAGIRNRNVGDELTYEGIDFEVGNVEYFSRDEWGKYVNQLGIEPEEEKFRLLYGQVSNDINFEDFDYPVLYNPQQEYTAILVKFKFKEPVDDKVRTMIKSNFIVSKRVNSEAFYYDDYYSKAMNDEENDNEVVCVYITNEEFGHAYMLITSLGNNVSVDLGER